MTDASEDFAAAAADAAEIAAGAATDANKLGSRLKGHGRWLDLALLVLLAFVVLILPCAAYGGLTKSPRLLEHWAARWACFVVACLAVLLAFEFGVLVKVSDFCVAPDSIDILANSNIRLDSVKRMTQIQNTSWSFAEAN